MPKFVLAFRGGMLKFPEEGEKMMTDRKAWMGTVTGALSGYSIVEATDMDAALNLAAKNPIFSLGGTIEVAPVMEM